MSPCPDCGSDKGMCGEGVCITPSPYACPSCGSDKGWCAEGVRGEPGAAEENNRSTWRVEARPWTEHEFEPEVTPWARMGGYDFVDEDGNIFPGPRGPVPGHAPPVERSFLAWLTAFFKGVWADIRAFVQNLIGTEDVFGALVENHEMFLSHLEREASTAREGIFR